MSIKDIFAGIVIAVIVLLFIAAAISAVISGWVLALIIFAWLTPMLPLWCWVILFIVSTIVTYVIGFIAHRSI